MTERPVTHRPTAVARVKFPAGPADRCELVRSMTRRGTHAGALLAALLALVVYANSLRNDLVYDDGPVIVANEAAHHPTHWRALFFTKSWGNELSYRPLTVWTFALDFALHGLHPFGYHLVNVIGHAAVAAGLVIVAAALGASPLAAGMAGVLFAVHPVHTESVANVVGRAELLAAGWVLLALLLQRRAAMAGWPLTGIAAAAGAYGLALLSKENAIALIALMPLADLVFSDGRSPWLFLRRLRGRRSLFYVGLCIVTAVYAALRRTALGGFVGDIHTVARWMNPTARAATAIRVLTALKVQALAGWLLIAPVHLSADYSHPRIPLVAGLAEPGAIAGAIVAAGVLAIAVVLWSRAGVAFFWLCLSVFSYGVVSNILFPIGTIFAERVLYLPSAGFCVLLAMLIEEAATSGGRRTAFGFLAGLVVLWSALTVLRNPVWHDDLAFGQELVRTAPESAHAHDTLGNTLAALGRREAALPEFAEALRIDPEDKGSLFDWSVNRAVILTDQEEFSAALDAADQAVAVRPELPAGYVERGLALRGLQRLDEAQSAFEEALRLDPRRPEALLDLAAVALDKADFALAAATFERLIAVAPSQQAYRGLVYSYRNAGREFDAARVAAAARRRYPGDDFFRPAAIASSP